MGEKDGKENENGGGGWEKARGLVMKTVVVIGSALLLRRLTKSTTRRDHSRFVSNSLTGEKNSKEQAAKDPDNYFNLRYIACPAAEMVDGSKVLYVEQAFWRTPQKPFRQMALLRRATSNLYRAINLTVASNNRARTSNSLFVPMTSRLYSREIDLSDSESRRRLTNRLLYRSKQRGFLELDLVLGKWVDENIHSMDESGFKSLIQVLDLENPDLWKWLTGQEQPPESVSINPVFSAVRERVTGNLSSHSAPETRATPGQPWVRGWDDIKRGHDSPVAGNQ